MSTVPAADAGVVASGRSLTHVSALARVLGSGLGLDAPGAVGKVFFAASPEVVTTRQLALEIKALWTSG